MQKGPSDAPFFEGLPRIGAVVGTYGTAPLVHMQLELLKHMQCLDDIMVHDDCSPEGETLRGLADAYGADYATPLTRQQHCTGDLSAFLVGLLWAKHNKLDYVVKISRRCITLEDWVSDVMGLLLTNPREHTIGHPIGKSKRKMTTYWIVMHVDTWLEHGFGQIEDLMVNYAEHWVGTQIEWWIEKIAKSVDVSMGVHRSRPFTYYDILRNPSTMWKIKYGPEHYGKISKKLGLPYTSKDFKFSSNLSGIFNSRRWHL